MIVQEPKDENPIAIIGRKFFNPSTPTEHPFKTGELEVMFMKNFGSIRAKHFFVFSPLCFIFEKIKFLDSPNLRDICFSILSPVDEILLHFDMFKKYSWIVIDWAPKS